MRRATLYRGQWPFMLYALASVARATTSEIALTVGCSWDAVNAILAKLELRGLVERAGVRRRKGRQATQWAITETGLITLGDPK